jgi:hypothetical protein
MWVAETTARHLADIIIPAVTQQLRQHGNATGVLFFRATGDIDPATGQFSPAVIWCAKKQDQYLLLTQPVDFSGAYWPPTIKANTLPLRVPTSVTAYSFAHWCLAQLALDPADVALLLEQYPRLYYFLDRCLQAPYGGPWLYL